MENEYTVSNRYEAVVLIYKHPMGHPGDIVPDKDGSLLKSGYARRLIGNIEREQRNGESK